MVKNRRFAAIWRIGLTLLALTGIVLSFIIRQGWRAKWQGFVYFTVQSNMFILIMFALLTVKTVRQWIKCGKDGKAASFKPMVQTGVIFYISITFIIFSGLLSWNLDYNSIPDDIRFWVLFYNSLVHYVVPVGAILDWVMFMPHGKLDYRAAAYWLLYPALYIGFVSIRARIGGVLITTINPETGIGSNYPYPFMDFTAIGWNAAWMIPCFLLFFFALGCLMVFMDRQLFPALPERIKRRRALRKKRKLDDKLK